MHCPNALITLKVPQFNKHVGRTRHYKTHMMLSLLITAKEYVLILTQINHINRDKRRGQWQQLHTLCSTIEAYQCTHTNAS